MGAVRWILCGAGLTVTLAFKPGCLITNMRYTDPVSSGANSITPSATDCQTQCANSNHVNVTCRGFTFYPHNGECWFSSSGDSANLHRQLPSEHRCYAGPVTCPEPPPACPAAITGEWPGADGPASDSAWSIGYQPSKLQCWPTYSYNGSYANCEEIQTLDDTRTGWPGKCLGLQKVDLSAGETCEEKCKSDVYCPGFQIGNDESCWHGMGEGCYDEPTWNYSWTPISAKRFQRGRVEVIKQLKGVQVIGLTKVFDKRNADMMPNASLQCQHSCYSVLECQYWQLSNVSGCWIEVPTSPVQNPLTKEKYSEDNQWDQDMIAGEFIQRMCTTPLTTTAPPTPPITTPLPPSTSSSVFSTTTTTTTTEAAGGFPWWGWLLLALLCCCCIAALAAFLLFGQKKSKKPKKGRKLPRRPPAQAPTPSVPLMQAQPVPTQLTAMPVYSAPPPVYTAVPAPVVAESRAIPMVAPQQPMQQPVMMAPQPASQFDMLDRNGDGVITRQEFQQAMGVR